MKLTHGSVQNVALNGGFQAFDHTLDHNNKEQEGFIDNGLDAYGPGVYTWLAEGEHAKDSVSNAQRYTGENGFVHFLSVEVDEEDFLNNMPSDEIEEETWAKIINNFIDRRHQQTGWNKEALEETLNDFYSAIESGEEIDLDLFKEQTQQFLKIDLDYHNPNEAECPQEWIDQILDEYDMEDPCIYVYEEGGPEKLASLIPTQHDDLWSVIKSMWNLVAVNGDGCRYESYNKTFIDACLEEVDWPLVGAAVEDQIFVVFDPSEIRINKVLQEEPEVSKNNGPSL